MTDEAKRIVEVIRCAAVFCTHCERRSVCTSECSAYQDANKAADLIERLSAELEAAKRDINEMIAEQGGNLDLCHWCKANCQGTMDYEECDVKSDWRGLCAENGGVKDD